MEGRIVRELRTGGRLLLAGGSAPMLAGLRAEASRTGKRMKALRVAPPGTGRARVLGGPFPLPFADQTFDVVVVSSLYGDAARTARGAFRVALPGGTLFMPESSTAAGVLEALGCRLSRTREGFLVVRMPGPRRGHMPVSVSGLDRWDASRVRRLLAGLPEARGYELVVKPLRYRTRPHVQAFCEFEEGRILVQVPVPFRPFTEDVPYRAQRVGAKGFHFRWYRKKLRFERPDELIRYLYLHEYYHWYLREVLNRPSAAETACDRFALQRL
jgi:SAM-dependent methyltransferase